MCAVHVAERYKMTLHKVQLIPDDAYAVIRKGKFIMLPVEEKKMIAKMIPPHMDKNWSFQAINVTKDQVDNIRLAFSAPEVKKANPFLQGDNGGWVMVEFWTKDAIDIYNASKYLFDLFELPYAQGQFTRKELGLE